ncbi:MAG: hypothetical protein IJ545_02100 [Alphaproteobacteria bacterium]|nr:hypothetical protein [Alphaproteobacteria bacterium]
MIDDLKVILFIVITAIISAVIRFKTLTQLCLDALLGFIMGYSFYLLLGYFIQDGATRSGFVGLIILISRPLYDCADNFIRTRLVLLVETKIGIKEKKGD